MPPTTRLPLAVSRCVESLGLQRAITDNELLLAAVTASRERLGPLLVCSVADELLCREILYELAWLLREEIADARSSPNEILQHSIRQALCRAEGHWFDPQRWRLQEVPRGQVFYALGCVVDVLDSIPEVPECFLQVLDRLSFGPAIGVYDAGDRSLSRAGRAFLSYLHGRVQDSVDGNGSLDDQELQTCRMMLTELARSFRDRLKPLASRDEPQLKAAIKEMTLPPLGQRGESRSSWMDPRRWHLGPFKSHEQALYALGCLADCLVLQRKVALSLLGSREAQARDLTRQEPANP